MAGGMTMMLLTARFGFTRILGLGHIFWIPLVIWLISRLSLHPPDNTLGWWIRAMIVLNSLSLLIDITDVMRYLAGDRKEIVAGLDPAQPASNQVPNGVMSSPSTHEI
jgi:hypothetical protein